MKTKKLYKGTLNFSKAELLGSVQMGAVGINLPMESGVDYTKEFAVKKDFMNFGSLWSSLNDPKFYENVNAQDVVPKPEDFIDVPFRLLSATVVGAGTWKATDFSNAKVLKGSMNRLEGKPVYKDHETDLDNWVGIVKGVKWTGETTQNGQKVPAGIDGLLAIDAKTNPKIARGVLLGSIFSNSVTVDFQWEMSHEFENEWDFYEHVGRMGSDGKMVRRVVKEINDYHETSLVWLGADPFAKAVQEDGTLKHIDVSSVYEYTKTSFGKFDKPTLTEESTEVQEQVKNNKKLIINFALDKNILSLADKSKFNSGSNTQNDNDMNKFLLAFLATFGEHFSLTKDSNISEDDAIEHLKKLSFISEDDKGKITLSDKFTKLAEEKFKADAPEGEFKADEFLANYTFVKAETLTTLESDVANLTKEKGDLETQVTSLEADATLGKNYLNFKREEAIRLYKHTVGAENVDEAVVTLFKEAKDGAVDGLLKQYTKGATEKFSGSCSDCGSHNFKFQSSFTGEVDAPEVDDAVLTSDKLREKYGASSIHIGRKE